VRSGLRIFLSAHRPGVAPDRDTTAGDFNVATGEPLNDH